MLPFIVACGSILPIIFNVGKHAWPQSKNGKHKMVKQHFALKLEILRGHVLTLKF